MTTRIVKSPNDIVLNSFKVADPIEGADIRELTDGLAFLEGYSLAKVAGISVPLMYNATVVTSGTLYASYWKSAGAKVAVVELEPPMNVETSGDSPKSAYMDITLPTGASWIGSAPFDSTLSSSVREYQYVNTGSVVRPALRALVDVTNVVSTSITTFTCSFYEVMGSASSSRGHGCNALTISELPRAFLFTSSADVGVDSTWTSTQQRGQLVDGSISSSFGFQRLVFELDRARYQVRSQQNISVMLESSNGYAWKKTYAAASGSLTYGLNTYNIDSSDRYFFFRAKNLYGTGDTTAPYRVRVTYRTEDAVGSHKLVLRYRPYGSSDAFSIQEIDCPPNTTLGTADADVNFPTTGTNQEVAWFLEANVTADPADVLYIYSFTIIENFT